MELEADEPDTQDLVSDDQEARFYTCHVCGDNWLSIRRVEDGDCKVTFVHQMGLQPLLKRTAYMTTPILMEEGTVERWDYFLGDDEIAEGDWRQTLDERRQVLRSICSN
ncbi:MAG: hypothetical protein AAGK21_14805 [Bacteroidota bacterium]